MYSTNAYTRAKVNLVVRLVKVLGMVEPALSPSEEGYDSTVAVAERRSTFAAVYNALPAYGCAAFWRAIEEPGRALEILVRCVRVAAARGDNEGRNRIIEIIICRTQDTNEYWADHALKHLGLQADEHRSLAFDLYADLCERVMRALIDPQRPFWEENFQHCLRFERKHTYQAIMTREGRWQKHSELTGAKNTAELVSLTGDRRVPRALLHSLDRAIRFTDGELGELEIEDERAQQQLLAIERTDLLNLVLQLPEKLRSVILLIFWEGRSERDTARILAITDRTVRNRLYEASRILRSELKSERGEAYG